MDYRVAALAVKLGAFVEQLVVYPEPYVLYFQLNGVEEGQMTRFSAFDMT